MALKRVSPSDASKFAASSPAVDAATLHTVQQMLDLVDQRGAAAVRELSLKYGDLKDASEPLLLPPAALAEAFNNLPVDQQQLLHRVADRIRAFARAQRSSLQDFEVPVPGGVAGQKVEAIQVAGCYAPGGRYPLPSSVLMTAVTARVAGVQRVVVASPRPALITLAAAHVAGADHFLQIGGAQSIAAMVRGLEEEGLPACGVVVGPGNKYVTAAKQLLSGRVAIDMLAGPSECLVVADDQAEAAVVAADLLAQAEHDVEARPLLVALSERFVQAVEGALQQQLATLTTSAVATESIRRHGTAIICADLKQAMQVATILAPEHLELHIAEGATLDAAAGSATRYGAMFVGGLAAEVFGDYGVGPNHVLPTGGTARHSAGLSVHSFIRMRTWIRLEKRKENELRPLIADTEALARLEGLEGHARAANHRLALLQ